jgi:hypothetical protein
VKRRTDFLAITDTMMSRLSPSRGWHQHRRPDEDDEDESEDDADKVYTSVEKNVTRDPGDSIWEKLGAAMFTMSPPFIFLSKAMMPPEAQPPFLIGGLIPICRNQFTRNFGRYPIGLGDSWGDAPEDQFPDRKYGLADMNPAVLANLRHGEIPLDRYIKDIAKENFPDCEALTWKEYPLELIVELPTMPDEEWRNYLGCLPSAFKGADFLLRYHNGPLTSGKGQPKPKPKLYPGSQIYLRENEPCQTDCPPSVGVLIRKGDERRVTCSYHKWDDKVKQRPGLLGKDDEEAKRVFQFVQSIQSKRPVGYLKERVLSTDIGLAKLDENEVVFENNFPKMGTVAKRFLHSREIKIWDEFLLSSSAPGKPPHKLVSMGMRFVIKHNEGKKSCITAKQILCAGNDPALTSKLRTSNPACGAVLVKCRDGKDRSISQEKVLEKGLVCAMFPYADLQANDQPGRYIQDYFMFADVFDPLIEDKWTIVPGPAAGSGTAQAVKTWDEILERLWGKMREASVEDDDEVERSTGPSKRTVLHRRATMEQKK